MKIVRPADPNEPQISEDYDLSPEDIARLEASEHEEEIDDEDDDDRLERRRTPLPTAPVEPVDSSTPLRGTLYRSMKATNSGSPLSWAHLVHLVREPLEYAELDFAGTAADDVAKLAKSELPYYAGHVAEYRNNAHVRGLSFWIIDWDEASEEQFRSESVALGCTITYPSANHLAGLKKGVFKAKGIIRASRWCSPEEWRWIYDAWILKRAPHADPSMSREAMGSYVPACGVKNRDLYWYTLDEQNELDVDAVLAIIGPPAAKTKTFDRTERTESTIPLSARLGLLQQKISDVTPIPRSSTSGELTGNRGMIWIRRVVFAGIALAVGGSEILDVVRQQNEQLSSSDRWLGDELEEAVARAEQYSDTIQWGADLPLNVPSIEAESVEADKLVERIATFAGGLLFVRAGMGVGKTQGASLLCRAHPEWKILWITSSVRSAREAANRSGLSYYQTAEKNETRVVVCVDSLHKWYLEADQLKQRDWDLVVCDELPECLNAIFFRCKRSQPTALFRMLTSLLRSAPHALAMSADLRQWHISVCAGSRAYETTLTSEVLVRHAFIMKENGMCDLAAWDHCMELEPDTQKIVVQSTSKRTVDTFYRRLIKAREDAGLPPLKIFILTRHTKMFDNFDEIVHQHDVILMNTAGGSALNCWVPIWRQFVILDNNAVVGSAAGQLIARFRSFTDDGMLIVGQRVTKGSGLLVARESVAAEVDSAAAAGSWADKIPYHDGQGWVRPHADAFDTKVNLIVDQRTQRNDPSFVAEAHRRGWTFEFAEWTSDTDPSTFAAQMRMTREELRDEAYASIANAVDISEVRFHEVAAQGYERDEQTESQIIKHMIQRDIYGDRDPDMPKPSSHVNRVDWWGSVFRWMKDVKRTSISVEDAKRWRDGEWARQMRRYSLLLMIEHAPAVGHHATEIAEPRRHGFDASRARGEGFEARLLELLLSECFGLRANAALPRIQRGRPGKNRPASTVGVSIDDLARTVLRLYRTETDTILAAGWGDRAAPTEETAIAWLGDSLRRAGIRLRRIGRGSDRRYLPIWPPRGYWKATYERLSAAYVAESASSLFTTKTKSRSDLVGARRHPRPFPGAGISAS